MTDITKCANSKCTKRGSCYRATAPDGEWQSVSMFEQQADGECGYWLYEPGSDEEPAKVEW